MIAGIKTVCASMLFTAFTAAAAMAAVEIGKEAPDFSLRTIEGSEVSLNELRGKVVVLEWFNRECPYVKKHYNSGSMQALQQEAKQQGVVWLTLDSTNPQHRSFTSSEEFKSLAQDLKMASNSVLLDSQGTVGRTYGAKTTPHMFIIGKEGTLLYQGAIDDDSSSFSDPAKAQNYVRAALEQISAGKPVAVTESKPYGCTVKYAD